MESKRNLPNKLIFCTVLLGLLGGNLGFELTILHTNDVHSRYDQTNKYSGKCTDSDAAQQKCFGGIPRIYAKVEEIRKKTNNTVLVDAGDQYQGTIWFFKYGGNITARFMNLLRYDVMAVGNHEFDRGVDGFRVLLQQANFPILSSNMDASYYSDVRGKVKPYAVLDIGGQRVGFVGYTTVDTKNISNTEMVKFNDEVASVTSQVQNLTSQGVNKIVCVGHAGYVKDLAIAHIPGVDVVVGGHTNTFLYTGAPPSDEEPKGDYPTVVTRTDGSRALVVQDYAYGKYLGFLQVEFDNQGEVVSWAGNPILLNASVPRDPGVLAEVAQWRKGVDQLINTTVGNTKVLLLGAKEDCRLKECNMGSVMADAMVVQNLRHSDGEEWNHVAIAILNGGSIRSPIEQGPITMADILTVQPFMNSIDLVELNGTILFDVLEHSSSQWDPEELYGGFLQFSGLRVTYDMSKVVGERVVEVKVKCADCPVPRFVDLEPSKVYKIAVSTFLCNGGDGYQVLVDGIIKRHIIGDLDSDVLAEYISSYSPITTGLEDRIRFVNSSQTSVSKPECQTGSATEVVFNLATLVTFAATFLMCHLL